MNFHGGNIYGLNKKILDFSSNINPLGVPESFKKALIERVTDFTRYPDIEYKELKKSIAEYLGINSPELIIPGNGAVEIIYKYMACMQRLGFKRIVCAAPTFSEYSRAAKSCGMEVVSIDIFINNYKGIDICRLLDIADDTTVIVLCNPNNPTGTLITKYDIEHLLKGLNAKNSRLLIDEAFIEFTQGYPNTSTVDLLEKYTNLTIVRAVTKFFGMPGIRLGYGITCDKHLAEGIRELLEPWNINTAAIIAASTVFKDKDYIKASKVWLEAERSYLYQSLSEIAAIEVYESQANFHLARLKLRNFDSYKLRDKLIEMEILIRTPDGFKKIDASYFRLVVKDRESNNKLIAALKKVTEQKQ